MVKASSDEDEEWDGAGSCDDVCDKICDCDDG